MRTIKTTTISILAVGLLAGSAVGVAAQDEVADPMAPATFSGTYQPTWPPVGVISRRTLAEVGQDSTEAIGIIGSSAADRTSVGTVTEAR